MSLQDRIQTLEKGEGAARMSTLVTVALTAVKAIVGYLSGSIALLADALHSLSDVFTSLAVWLGLRLSQRTPSERFPYGFYRVETLTFLLVSVIIVASGAQILAESFTRILTPQALTLRLVTLPVASLSAVVSFLLFQYKSHIGRETNSQALLGEAKHSMVDVWSSILVFVGILAHCLGLVQAEPTAGFLIGLLTVWLGVGMGKDAVLILLDACLKPELVTRMRRIAVEVFGVKGVHDIRVRRSGPFVFAEMHVELDRTMSVEKAAQISDTIEDEIRRSIKQLDSLLVRTEPTKKEACTIVVPVQDSAGLDSRISDHFGRSPYFIFIDWRDDQPASWFVVENPGARLEKRRGIESAHLLARHKADVLVAREVGEGPYHVLRDSSIQILDLNRKSDIKEILKAFSRNELRSLVPAK